jgi:hypothetical protein
MSLILISMAIGLLPAWRGSLFGVLMGGWLLAGGISAAILLGALDLSGVLPVLALVVLGYNVGVGMGFGLNYAVSLKTART